MDRLQSLLQRFSVSASLFHSGPLCGLTDFSPNGHGQLHLLRRGPMEVRHAGEVVQVTQPSLLFYPRPLAHRFITDAEIGADMACANLSFGANDGNPIALALPSFVLLPLDQLHGAEPALELLFYEAFTHRCGRQGVVDRLFEVVLILVLRHLLDSGRLQHGPLAGLGHPQLAKALTAIHDSPGRQWTLETLCEVAGMSRSRFAEVFARVVGVPPASYLANFRITLAKDALLQGTGLDRIAQQVGYSSAAAFSRAFTSVCGQSPRSWQQSVSTA